MATVTKDALKGRNGTKGISSAVNKASGKKSIKDVAFSDANWGDISRKYMISVQALPERVFQKITEAAQPYVTLKSTARYAASSDEFGDEDGNGEEDKRALLVCVSDMEDDI